MSVIRIQGVTHSYDEASPAIHDVTCKVRAGAFCCIIGQNGSGKTTLVKHINGLLRPDSGSVTVLGNDTSQYTVAQLAHDVSYCFQNPDHQICRPTVREEVAFGPQNLHLNATIVDTNTGLIIDSLGLTPWIDAPPTMLSLGQRKLVCLAAAMVMQPKILVLDEPTVGLDSRTSSQVLDYVEQLREKGCTVVCVTHDMELVADRATQTIVMQKGRIIADGPTASVLTDMATLRMAHVTPTQVIRLVHDLESPHLPRNILTVQRFCLEYAERLDK